ncbi:DUF6434 domain-containing protein [Clostridium sp. MB05]|uniref:DUF6434 domain-containing protein n=1 Tax=Clostridium sp. MB05 TaxID=3376682 RepID=UPI003982D676
MTKRPILNRDLNSKTFQEYYYLKEELVTFCRNEGLSTSGGKIELTDRISHFLDTGEKRKSESRKKTKVIDVQTITEESKIEDNFVCSEKHRAFFKKRIGDSFSFPVTFQKWLKENTGKTYKEAIDAYYQILEEKKKVRTTIDRQFEYNTYIRDFFANNEGRSLEDAIKCWKYKKGLKGHNRYEKTDLSVLTI